MPSPLTRVGAPVVMGPLNGGMTAPPAFRDRDSGLVALIHRARPPLALAANTIVRGPLAADVLLIANERTRALLPGPARRHAVHALDIGVVLDSWPAVTAPRPAGGAAATRFLFIGRLVGWKAVDLLLDSFARLAGEVPAHLDIVGDGPERARLTERARRLGCACHVTFHGWLDPAGCARRMQACDVFVSAALQESGGIAVLEAMLTARPVIATAWGGHLDTLDDATGTLVGCHPGRPWWRGRRPPWRGSPLPLSSGPSWARPGGAGSRSVTTGTSSPPACCGPRASFAPGATARRSLTNW